MSCRRVQRLPVWGCPTSTALRLHRYLIRTTYSYVYIYVDGAAGALLLQRYAYTATRRRYTSTATATIYQRDSRQRLRLPHH